MNKLSIAEYYSGQLMAVVRALLVESVSKVNRIQINLIQNFLRFLALIAHWRLKKQFWFNLRTDFIYRTYMYVAAVIDGRVSQGHPIRI